MKPPAIFRLLPAVLTASLILLCLTGCASEDEIAAQRKWETRDERASREVFRSNWLRPSVPEEDKNFFYRPFFKTSND